MTKKKTTNLSKVLAFDQRTVEERVLDAVRHANVHDIIDILMMDFLFEANDENLWWQIESYLSEIYDDIYLVRCSVLENPPETAKQGLVNIRFVGIDEDFTLTIGYQKHQISEQLPLNLKITK